MLDVGPINRFLQKELGKRGMREVAAVEAASWLDQAGLLRDSPTRRGKPLHDLLRARKIWGQHQYLNRRWVIKRARKAEAGSRRLQRAEEAVIVTKGRQATALQKVLERYDKRCANRGSFRLKRGENLRDCIQRNGTPEMPAAYLIYAVRRRRSELLYIGKSGTLRTDGTFKDQGLATRLRMKQGKKWRSEFYAEEMRHLRLTALEFRWWVTFDKKVRILPMRAEAELIQAYFDDHKRLPAWNRAA